MPDALSSPLASLRRLPASAPGRKPDRDARIIAEFPTRLDIPALATELGMPRASLYQRAKALGVRRDPAITEQARREQAKASYRKQLARRNDTLRLDRSKLDPPPVERSPAEDARRARGWQLAEVLLASPRSWLSLRRAGWTEPAMRHLLGESPDWFRGVEWDGELVQVELTEVGRVEFGPAAPLGYAAHHKRIKL